MSKSLRIKVNPKVLNHYIEKSEISIEIIRNRSNLKKIEQWLSGDVSPTFNQLNQLAKILRVPYTYLIIDEVIVDNLPLLDFRTLNSIDSEKTSRDLIDTIKQIEKRNEFIVDYRKDNGFEPYDYVGAFKVTSNINEVTTYIRKTLKIEKFWQLSLNRNSNSYNFFRDKLRDIGVQIFKSGYVNRNTKRTLEIDEFRAFVIVNKYAPTIFINSNDSTNGMLFSLLHEFAHILLGQSNIFNVNDTDYYKNTHMDVEKYCNEIAGEIIVPKSNFSSEWEKTYGIPETYSKIENLAYVFKTSKTVIARKALSLSLIDNQLYNEIAAENREEYLTYKKELRKKTGGPDYWNVQFDKMDPNFYASVYNSFQSGNIEYTEAKNILDFKNRKEFKRYNERFIEGGIK